MPTTTSRPHAVAYVRVSTLEQAAEGLSLEAQEAKLRAYCELRGLHLVEVLVDAGVSAGKPLADREGGAALVAHLRRRKDPVAHVVAFKLDRLFRNTVDALQRVEDWSKAGVALHLVDLGGQAVDTSNGMGRFFLTMLAGLAELERAQISERTTAVLAHKRANAQRTSLHAPYGWRISRNGKDLQRVEAEQRVLKLIDSLKADGHSVRSIARALEARGCKPRGSRWHTNTVHRLLHRKPVGVGV